MRTEYTKGLKGKGKRLYMHRLLLDAPEDMQVDHKNQDGLDNRRSNLRLATPSQNQMNKKMMKNNTSGYRGVSWDKKSNKWRVSVNVAGRHFSLGRFDGIEEAAKARDEFVIANHGEFARVN